MDNKWMAAGELLRTGGQVLADTLETVRDEASEKFDGVVDYFNERKAQAEETTKILQQNQEAYQKACSRSYACQEMLKREYVDFCSQVAELDEKFFSTYRLLCDFADVEYEETMTEQQDWKLPSQQLQVWSPADSVLLKAVGTGLLSGATAVGLATALGTASTGTAISSLSGAAYLSSLLACMGGGSLAAGGLGIAGGVAALSAVVAVPAAAFALYKADEAVQKNYEQALLEQRKVQEYCAEVESRWQKGMLIRRAVRSLTMNMYSFSQFFRDMLNMGAFAVSLKKNSRYMPLLNDAAITLAGYTQLNVLAKDDYNPDFEENLRQLNLKAEKCRQEFYNFFLSLSTQEQSLLEAGRQEEFSVKLEQAKADLSGRFGDRWKRLDNKSQNFLVSGRAIFYQLAAARQMIDYSSVCVVVSKAVEGELKRRLFSDFCRYMEERLPLAEHGSQWPSGLCQYKDGKGYVLRASEQLTLGSIAYLCHFKPDSRLSEAARNRNLHWLSQYGRDRLFRNLASEEEIWRLLWEIGRFADSVASNYRNPAAHSAFFGYQKAVEFFAYVLEGEKSLPWIVQQFRK